MKPKARPQVKTYKCAVCDKRMSSTEQPMFCPYCAAHGRMMRVRKEGKMSPDDTVMRLNALIPSYKAAYEAFVKVYGECFTLRRRLVVAASRGYIDADLIPALPPVKLVEDAKKMIGDANE